jgi:hypothetical protein
LLEPLLGTAGRGWDTGAMSERPGRYQRSFSGMIGAMIVLVLVVAAFVVLRDLNRTEPENPVKPVDYTQPAEYAREQAEFELLTPDRLPEGWFATSARFRDGRDQSWHLSFLTGDGKYVGVEQLDVSAGQIVEDFVDEDAEQGEDVVIDGATWESWSDSGGDSALVREGDEITTLVVGTIPAAELERFVTTLR